MDTFATVAVALYAAHHVGDYWVQANHQAMHKGNAGLEGIMNCLSHVWTYTLTQFVFLVITFMVTDVRADFWKVLTGLAISAITHYLADRGERGLMFKIARAMPWKRDYLAVSGGPAFLDQSWHIFWGVFVAALVISL